MGAPRTGSRLATAVAATAVLATGCGREDADTLRVVERFPIPVAGAESAVLTGSRDLWLGAPGEVVRLDPGDAPRVRTAVGGAGAPVWLGSAGGRNVFRRDRDLLALDTLNAEVAAEAPNARGEVAFDPAGRYLYRSEGAGAVVVHDLETLTPIFGWADVGAPALAMAVAPDGAHLYQAIASGEGTAPRLIVRDTRSGRVLRRIDLVEPLWELVAADGGLMYGVSVDDSDATAVELYWREGTIAIGWRHRIGTVNEPARVSLTLSPDATRLAILEPGNEEGLRVLDVRNGEEVGRLKGAAIGLFWGPGGGLFLLREGELVRVG